MRREIALPTVAESHLGGENQTLIRWALTLGQLDFPARDFFIPARCSDHYHAASS